jgi:alkanesulfonate monooxygenase SsuD/methylene tetrahydromethanopterin reductase-like flavin-dependent oxidoreductase (luciferase family)
MKKIGFLSFNHWSSRPGSQVRSAQQSLLQSIELAQAAEEVGIDGAFFRVHHFAEQQSSPFPLMSAIAAKTSRIQIGTGVIDMRYENPLGMAEEAASTDLISGGRLQLGVSRGSPQHADRGYEVFGYVPTTTDADMAAEKTDRFLAAINGVGVARPNPERFGPNTPLLPITPVSDTLPTRIWWGAGSRATAESAAARGMNLMSSTLMTEDTGIPFEQLQREQIDLFRAAWAKAAWDNRPSVSVSRGIIPIVDDETAAYFGSQGRQDDGDQVGLIEGVMSRFGRQYVNTPEGLVEDLRHDVALDAADWALITIPNQLGVDFNVKLLSAIHAVGAELGWSRANPAAPALVTAAAREGGM